MRFFKNIKGETIAETIIAVTILAIGITITSTLMSTSIQNMNNSKNRIIAINIAREGLEAIRNIRDTNWLRFSGKRRICWNHLPQNLTAECADSCNGGLSSPGTTDTPIEPGTYIVYKAEGIGGDDTSCDIVQRWRLASVGNIEGSSPALSNSTLYHVDIDEGLNSDGDESIDGYTNDWDMYNHLLNVDPDAEYNDVIGRRHAVRTPFSRTITIAYLENQPDASTSPSNQEGLPDIIDTEGEWSELVLSNDVDAVNRIIVTSTVSWMRGSVAQSVQLKTHLTDYLGRDNLSN